MDRLPARSPTPGKAAAPQGPRPGQRRRWPRRLRQALLLLLVATVAGWIMMDWHATNVLEREIAIARANGEWAVESTLAPLHVPEAQNAAPAYDEADAAVRLSRQEAWNLDRWDPRAAQPTLTGVEVGQLVARNEEAIRLAALAATRPHMRYPPRMWAGLVGTGEHRERLRRLSIPVRASALLGAVEGRPREFHTGIVTLYRLSGHLAQEPSDLSQRASAAMEWRAHHALAAGMRYLPLGQREAETLLRAVPRSDRHALVRRAWLEEQRYIVHYYEAVRRRPVIRFGPWRPLTVPASDGLVDASPLWAAPVWRPMLKLDQAAYIRAMRVYLRAAGASGPWPARDPLPQDALPKYAVVASLTLPFWPGGRQIEHTEALRALARSGLALAAYRATHSVYPSRVSDATALLGFAPAPDPFTGRPLVYRRVGAGYQLRSVGPNGRDDGGRSWRDIQDRRKQAALRETLDDIAWPAADAAGR
jgi:hypothetical protein